MRLVLERLRKFIRDYSRIAQPLTALLKGSVNSKKPRKLELDEAVTEAFYTLYDAFTKAPILVHFKRDTLIKVETDASNFACSVAFWSRKFIDTEKNYETYDQEMLAIVGAFKH
ncbi:hypothetical protein Q7P36_002863 [Cladosporium allicinum]